jgi:hypothetical protein
MSKQVFHLVASVPYWDIQGIHKRMVRFQLNWKLKPHHSFVYALYSDDGTLISDGELSV